MVGGPGYRVDDADDDDATSVSVIVSDSFHSYSCFF
jgi:hypothetical protein